MLWHWGVFNILRMPWLGVSILAVVVLLAGLLAQNDRAGADHGFEGCTVGVGIEIEAFYAGTNDQAGFAVDGDMVEYEITASLGDGRCPIEGGVVELTLPDLTVIELDPFLDLEQNEEIVYPREAYTVDDAHLGQCCAAGADSVRARADVIDAQSHRFLLAPQNVSAAADWDIVVVEPLTVEKNATPSFDRDFEWTIEKDVDPDNWNLFDGDTGTSEYTVEVTKSDPIDSNFAVTGEIFITNPNLTTDVEVTSVIDEISGVGAATVNCPGGIPQTIVGGGSLTCTYSSALPDDTTRTNTATVVADIALGAGLLGLDLGGVATADIDFTGVDPTTVTDDEVNVDDTNPEFGGPITVDDDMTWMYDVTFDCDGVVFTDGHGSFTHPNTAEIIETGQTSSEDVDVDCYQLLPDKNAETEFDRLWLWDILKTADPTEATLQPGETLDVDYDVTVSVTGTEDSGWMVSGTITIENPNPDRDAELTELSDVISPDIAATLDCDGPTDVIPAGTTLTCTYEEPLPDGSSRTNTVTAIQQNYAFDSEGVGTENGTTTYEASADVEFGDPTNEIDFCVDVSDTIAGPLGVVCADAAPHTFEYTETFGPFTEEDCGQTFEFPNTATFVTVDTGATGSSDALVTITVECLGGGCTPGFWKTHPDLWQGYSPDQTVGSVFSNAEPFHNNTLLEALNFGGGPGINGAKMILLRAAVAALLNAAHDDVPYVLSEADVIDQVNAALASGNRGTMLSLAAELDEFNNEGCTIDAHGNPIEPEAD